MYWRKIRELTVVLWYELQLHSNYTFFSDQLKQFHHCHALLVSSISVDELFFDI